MYIENGIIIKNFIGKNKMYFFIVLVQEILHQLISRKRNDIINKWNLNVTILYNINNHLTVNGKLLINYVYKIHNRRNALLSRFSSAWINVISNLHYTPIVFQNNWLQDVRFIFAPIGANVTCYIITCFDELFC